MRKRSKLSRALATPAGRLAASTRHLLASGYTAAGRGLFVKPGNMLHTIDVQDMADAQRPGMSLDDAELLVTRATRESRG